MPHRMLCLSVPAPFTINTYRTSETSDHYIHASSQFTTEKYAAGIPKLVIFECFKGEGGVTKATKETSIIDAITVTIEIFLFGVINSG